MIERTIETTTHGRYIVEPAAGAAAAPLLIGFHGYGEAAETQMDRMRAIPGADQWLLLAIQGLHRFYHRRTNGVIASWMTRQDRELAIADNLAYVSNVIDTAAREWPVSGTLVFAGFSQGVAMAFRAAANSRRTVAGIITAGGDVPPEIAESSLARVNDALICHGSSDDWYTRDKFAQDERRLREAGVNVRALEFDGGHEWSDEVVEAAGTFLGALRQERPL